MIQNTTDGVDPNTFIRSSFRTETMTRVTPAIMKPVVLTGQTEGKDNQDQSEAKENVNMSTCLNDIPFKIARPLVISMSLFGLLHLSGRETSWAPITKIYSTIVLLVLWAMFFRSFTLYGTEGFGLILIFKIILQCWICMCATSATSTFLACRRQNRFVEFLTRWSELLKTNHRKCQAFGDVSISNYVRKAKLSFYSCLLFAWFGVVVAWGSIGYGMFMADSFDFILSPMAPSHPQALLLKCILCVVFCYLSAAWVFPCCLFYNIGSVIYEEFRIFHEDFKNGVHPNGDIVGIGIYRRRHQEICLLVENADDILSGFSAVGITVCTVNVMLILYSMLWYSGNYTDLVVLLSNIFWLLSALVQLCVIAVGGGYLNHMAHEPLKTIHNIHLKTISTEISLQMTMFLNKLTGESIGLTAMGMFVIDKPTILTIAGAFLTYFVVLAQFQQPSDQKNGYANCTVLLGQ